MDAIQLMSAYKAVRKEEPLFQDNPISIVANKDASKNGLMLVGMNPSGKEDGKIYDYLASPNNFFRPKHEMMGKYNSRCAYIDLFPFRNGRQDIASDDNELRYRGKLLSYTRDYIESISPRLIIYANTATRYWGFCGDWMGYKFTRIQSPLEGDKQSWPLYMITDIISTDVNRHVTNSKLIN